MDQLQSDWNQIENEKLYFVVFIEVLLGDMHALVDAPMTENFDEGVLVAAEALHGRVQRSGVGFRVAHGRPANSRTLKKEP